MVWMVSFSTAQVTIQPRQMDYSYSGVLYNSEKTFLAALHTNGVNFGYRNGSIRKYYLTNYTDIDIGTLKHPKEYNQNIRTQSVLHNISSAGAFTYGKQNSFFTIRAGLGAKRYFSEKARRKGVSVALTYEGGPSLGILKPYYLDLRKFNGDRYYIQSVRYSEKTAGDFLDINNIVSSSSAFKGFGEISLVPGLQGKSSVNFSFGDSDEYVKSIEAGLMIDVFPRSIPIMINTPNSNFFINFFLQFEFGKRK